MLVVGYYVTDPKPSGQSLRSAFRRPIPASVSPIEPSFQAVVIPRPLVIHLRRPIADNGPSTSRPYSASSASRSRAPAASPSSPVVVDPPVVVDLLPSGSIAAQLGYQNIPVPWSDSLRNWVPRRPVCLTGEPEPEPELGQDYLPSKQIASTLGYSIIPVLWSCDLETWLPTVPARGRGRGRRSLSF